MEYLKKLNTEQMEIFRQSIMDRFHGQRKELFWEISLDRIKQILRESDDWVIVRVFEYGEIQDIFDVIYLYGEKKVKEVLGRERLKPTATVMAYLFLDVDRYGKYVS